MRLGFFEKALFLQFRDDELPRFEAIFAAITFDPFAALAAIQERSGVDARVGVEDADLIQAETLADVEIVKIVSRRDLQRAGAEFAIDQWVGDERNDASGNWQANFFADQSLIALVIRMHGDGGIAEHGFRSGGRHDKGVCWIIGQGITDVPKTAVSLFVHHFDVGERGFAARTPIDQSLRPIETACPPRV